MSQTTPSRAQSTTELRQVCVEGDSFMGEPKVRYYRVQQRWLVFDGLAQDTELFCGSLDGAMLNNVVGRSEWRDLPIVSETAARADSAPSTS